MFFFYLRYNTDNVGSLYRIYANSQKFFLFNSFHRFGFLFLGLIFLLSFLAQTSSLDVSLFGAKSTCLFLKMALISCMIRPSIAKICFIVLLWFSRKSRSLAKFMHRIRSVFVLQLNSVFCCSFHSCCNLYCFSSFKSDSESSLFRMFSLTIPQTNLSRRASHKLALKSQCCESFLSSATYTGFETPSFWSCLWKRKRSAITNGLGTDGYPTILQCHRILLSPDRQASLNSAEGCMFSSHHS